MTDQEHEEHVICGRLPRRANGTIDFHAVDRLLRSEPESARRVALLKRVAEEKRR